MNSSYYEKIGNTVSCIDEELPFELPNGWSWCRLSHISEITMGSSPNGTNICEDNYYTEFHQGKIYFTNRIISSSNQYTKEITKIAQKNSVLLCVRAPVGEVNITDRIICIGRGLAAVLPVNLVDILFMFYWLQAFKYELISKATGTTFVAVTAPVVKNLLIPLPPITEQERIVKLITTLFEIFDNIEKSLN